jgi:hypothetical protein
MRRNFGVEPLKPVSSNGVFVVLSSCSGERELFPLTLLQGPKKLSANRFPRSILSSAANVHSVKTRKVNST